jgi:prepilin-type N-terminal cleavage/methylation domain-containing protein
MKTKNINKGFTLIEVLLVITLIGILLTIGLVNFNSEARFIDARNDIRKTHIRTLESAVNQYKLQEGSYPTGLDRTHQEICDPAATDCTGFFDLKAFLVPKYLQAIPRDPKDTDNTGGAGYSVAVDEDSNIVSIRSLQAEGGVDIKVNDPLPDIETSSTNTPLAATVPNSPPPSIVNNGLVLHLDAGNQASYPGTGNTWFDLSGNGNNGTLVNGVGYNSDNGGSLSFDGVNDYVIVSNNISPGTGDFSVAAWVYKTEIVANRYIWDFGANGGTLSTGTSITNGFRYYNPTIGTGGVLYNSGPIHSINTWYNIVISRISGSTKFYSNGFLITSANDSGNIGTWGTNFNIGRYGGGGYNHQGNIAHILVYKGKGLTPQEIQQNYNALKGRFGL